MVADWYCICCHVRSLTALISRGHPRGMFGILGQETAESTVLSARPRAAARQNRRRRRPRRGGGGPERAGGACESSRGFVLRAGGGRRPVGMRSEEGAGGLGTSVSARGASWREKPSPAEAQLPREPPRREPAMPPASSFGEGGARKPREEKKAALSKVVLRRLPPGLTKEQLEEQLRPLPAHDYFEVVAADLSLYPHLYSRAYINFRNPDDILLFRDRFDGYIFIGNKGLEYPAVVEFAPFQKIAKKKLKKKDSKTGSIEDDPEYKQFLETYSLEEEKTSTSPETLLGEIEAKTRELLARKTTPLLEYIKNRKLEKQRIREEKREERRRRELEKKRLREEEKRKRREEERCKRKEADKQKKTEKEVRIKLLKKLEKGEEPTAEKTKERGEEASIGEEKLETCASVKNRPSDNLLEMPGEKMVCPSLYKQVGYPVATVGLNPPPSLFPSFLLPLQVQQEKHQSQVEFCAVVLEPKL